MPHVPSSAPATNWRIFYVKSENSCRRKRSVCRAVAAAARRDCGARRSRRWPASASPGTPGWNKAGKSMRRWHFGKPGASATARRRRPLPPVLLAHQRPPVPVGHQWCQVSPLVRRLLDDLPLRPAYVMNLSWDIIAWNPAAQRLFAIDERPAQERNMLWMLFADPQLNERLLEWEAQAPQILASFRRDYARAPEDEVMRQRVQALERVSPPFRRLWRQHDIHGRCQGRRSFTLRKSARSPLTTPLSSSTKRITCGW